MCLYPKIIKNRKYTANKKNKGVIPQVKDKRVLYVPVACGNCMECRKQKARQWQVRLQEELRNNKNGKMVTLTLSNEAIAELSEGIELEGYDLDNEIATKAVRRYLERWRKKYKKSCRHWLVTELGQTSTERVHIHGIMWTDEVEDITKIWKYGQTWVGDYVSERTVNYIVKYISKIDVLHKEYKSKVLTSAGIGSGYMERMDSTGNEYKEGKTREVYITREGVKLNLPIYYRNKIYTEEEKEKLWVEKLDKEERWVDGVKVSVKGNDELYYKVLKGARKKNKRLGYGDSEINWERRRYERQRRNMLKRGKNLGKRKRVRVSTQQAKQKER